MTLWNYILRDSGRRPGRTLLTLAGIILAVATVTAIRLSNVATRDAYGGMYNLLAGRADLDITAADGQSSFRPDLDALTAIPGVERAIPLLQVPAGLVTPDGPVSLVLLGIDPKQDGALRSRRLVAGDDVSDREGIVLAEPFALRHALRPGERVKLLTGNGPVELPILGLVAGEGAARFNGGAVAFLDLNRCRRLLGTPGKVNTVQLLLSSTADREKIRQEIENLFPSLLVETPTERGALARQFLLPTEQALSTLGVIALVCGILVILNTLLMHLHERRRQLALLRALGATRWQVIGMVLRQALLFGLAGTVVGLPLGLLAARWLLDYNQTYLDVPLGPLPLPVGELLRSIFVGPVLTVVVALFPAMQAARQAPLDGLTRRDAGTAGAGGPVRSWWPPLLGVVFVGLVITYEVGVFLAWLSPKSGTLLMPLVAGLAMAGCALILPVVVPPLLHLVALIVRRFSGVTPRLAVRQLVRHPTRSSLTVGVLFAALASSISFGNTFINNLDDIRNWYQSSIKADYIVRAAPVDPALVVTPAPLPGRVPDELARLPGFASSWRFRFLRTRAGDQPVLAIARDFDRAAPASQALLKANDNLTERLHRGEVVLGSALATRLGVRVGDTVTLRGKDGPLEVTVAGISTEYTAGGLALVIEWNKASEYFGPGPAHGIAINALEGKGEELDNAMEQYCATRILFRQRNDDFVGVINRVADSIRLLMTGLVLLVGVVAGLGVVNTLTANVLDQTRELGVLRAVGMKRGQVSLVVLTQALVLALVSCVPGVPIGLGLALLMNRSSPPLIGHAPPFRVEGWLVVFCVLAVSMLACLAGLIPARRAGRQPVIEALRYE